MIGEKTKLRVVVHEQMSVSERRVTRNGIPAGKRRKKYYFEMPGWILPKNGILHTITASIIWGICGRMADMPDYGEHS